MSFLCLGGLAAGVACDPASHQATTTPAAPAESTQATNLPAPEPATAAGPAAPREDPTLIPRRVLFGADHTRVRISPDGTKLGWVGPVNGVRNVWVAPIDALSQARPVTHDATRNIHTWEWSPTSTQIFYGQDERGDENTHQYLVDLSTGDVRDLTPGQGVRSTIEAMSPKDPRHVVLGQNSRDPRVVDLYRLDLTTGERSLLAQNEGDYTGWAVDPRFHVTGAHRANADGSLDVLSFEDKSGTKTVLHVPFEDIGTVELLGHDRGVQYMKDSRGRATAALVSVDMKTGATQVLAEDPRADVGHVVSWRGKPLAASFTDAHTRWQVIDPSVRADFDALGRVASGDMSIDSRSADDNRWIVSYRTDNQPRVFYLYDRTGAAGAGGHATQLFSQSTEAARLALPDSRSVVIPSRDGLSLVSYLTLPMAAQTSAGGKPAAPLPMVLWVHAGPQDRDGSGFDEGAQWLANRGYAVLKVNFRGSTGFGKNFQNAGNGQYGGTMQNDLLDAAAWAVHQGIADPAKIAILGPSYGGYAALTGLASTPDTFACGVDTHGPTNLLTRLGAPPFTFPSGTWDVRRIGDPPARRGVRYCWRRLP